GGTVPQPIPPEGGPEPAQVATAALTSDLVPAPARLDVAAFVAAQQREEAEQEVGRPAFTVGRLRDFLKDEEVVAALAEAGRMPAVAPVTTMTGDVTTQVPPAAPLADGAADSGGGERPRAKETWVRLPAAWLLLPTLVYGLVRQWGGWPKLHAHDERED